MEAAELFTTSLFDTAQDGEFEPSDFNLVPSQQHSIWNSHTCR